MSSHLLTVFLDNPTSVQCPVPLGQRSLTYNRSSPTTERNGYNSVTVRVCCRPSKCVRASSPHFIRTVSIMTPDAGCTMSNVREQWVSLLLWRTFITHEHLNVIRITEHQAVLCTLSCCWRSLSMQTCVQIFWTQTAAPAAFLDLNTGARKSDTVSKSIESCNWHAST